MLENIIDLKSKLTPSESAIKDNVDFEIHHITENELASRPLKFHPPIKDDSKIHELKTEVRPSLSEVFSQPSKTIEVDFAMFSELVANPNSKQVIKENPEEKITLSANLLTKLASATEEKNNNKLSIIFCVGLIIGITFAWVLLNEL